MGRLSDELAGIEPKSRFSQTELEQMFSSAEEKAALAQVKEALRKQTNDLTAMNDLLQKGGAVLGVLVKVARTALGSA